MKLLAIMILLSAAFYASYKEGYDKGRRDSFLNRDSLYIELPVIDGFWWDSFDTISIDTIK